MRQSFIVKKLQQVNSFWNYKFFSDHLGLRERLILLNAIRKKSPIVFYSVESSIHGLKYWRPYNLSKFNITYKKLNKKNTFWFPAFADEYLSGSQISVKPALKKSSKILLVSSNTNKIIEVEKKMGHEFKELDFYGLFSKTVPSKATNQDMWKNYHQDSSKLMSRYEATLTLDNSYEDGYIQGSWMRAIRAKSVPILAASKAVKENVIDHRAFIDFEDFLKMSKAERKREILKVKEFLYSEKQVFSNVMQDYLSFLVEVDFISLEEVCSTSQYFREKIFPE